MISNGDKALDMETKLQFEDGSESKLGDELQAIDDAIEENKKAIEKGEYLKELNLSKAFDVIFNIGYVDEESERLRQALINPTMFRKEAVDNMMSMMSGIRHFKQYIDKVYVASMNAPDEIENLEERRKQITEMAATM